MSSRPKYLIVALILLVVGCCLCNSHYALAQTSQTASKIQTANTAVEEAFGSVLHAEKAGASVSSLLNQLNNATSLLSRAENAYRSGDNDTAINDADAVVLISKQVTLSAQTAQQSATVDSHNAFFYNVVFTVVASFFFVLVMFYVWRLFKRRYINRLSRAKPEVNSYEA